MRLVERHIIQKKHENWLNIDHLCFLSKNLYNQANYRIRQIYFETRRLKEQGGWLKHAIRLSYIEINKMLKDEDQLDYRALPNNSSQQILKLLDKNWKSYFAALREYTKNPKEFTGKPKAPGYKEKEKGRNIIIFTNGQIKINDQGIINFPKIAGILPIHTKIKNNELQQVRIIPCTNCYTVEVVYKRESSKVKDLDNHLFLSIDLGVDNLITTIDNTGNPPFIINGKLLKSINRYYNKKKAKLQSYIGDKKSSNRIRKLTFDRNQKVYNFIHHASKLIAEYASNNKIKNIIIGHNKFWKQEINLGKVNNQKFVNIPFNMLISQIEYKCNLLGCKVKIVEESYTSKIDHLAGEHMKHQDKYLGKRPKRGMFISSTGKMINSDVNGALGIALKDKTKVSGESLVKEIVSIGRIFNPIRINAWQPYKFPDERRVKFIKNQRFE